MMSPRLSNYLYLEKYCIMGHGFWGPGDGCRSDTGSETVPGQFFASIYFRGLGLIRKYSENLYTVKISTYTVLNCSTSANILPR